MNNRGCCTEAAASPHIESSSICGNWFGGVRGDGALVADIYILDEWQGDATSKSISYLPHPIRVKSSESYAKTVPSLDCAVRCWLFRN